MSQHYTQRDKVGDELVCSQLEFDGNYKSVFSRLREKTKNIQPPPPPPSSSLVNLSRLSSIVLGGVGKKAPRSKIMKHVMSRLQGHRHVGINIFKWKKKKKAAAEKTEEEIENEKRLMVMNEVTEKLNDVIDEAADVDAKLKIVRDNVDIINDFMNDVKLKHQILGNMKEAQLAYVFRSLMIANNDGLTRLPELVGHMTKFALRMIGKNGWGDKTTDDNPKYKACTDSCESKRIKCRKDAMNKKTQYGAIESKRALELCDSKYPECEQECDPDILEEEEGEFEYDEPEEEEEKEKRKMIVEKTPKTLMIDKYQNLVMKYGTELRRLNGLKYKGDALRKMNTKSDAELDKYGRMINQYRRGIKTLSEDEVKLMEIKLKDVRVSLNREAAKFKRKPLPKRKPPPKPRLVPVVKTLEEELEELGLPPIPKDAQQEDFETVVALEDFPGDKDGELKVKSGDEILILNRDLQDDEGWVVGEIDDRQGRFPLTIIEHAKPEVVVEESPPFMEPEVEVEVEPEADGELDEDEDEGEGEEEEGDGELDSFEEKIKDIRRETLNIALDKNEEIDLLDVSYKQARKDLYVMFTDFFKYDNENVKYSKSCEFGISLVNIMFGEINKKPYSFRVKIDVVGPGNNTVDNELLALYSMIRGEDQMTVDKFLARAQNANTTITNKFISALTSYRTKIEKIEREYVSMSDNNVATKLFIPTLTELNEWQRLHAEREGRTFSDQEMDDREMIDRKLPKFLDEYTNNVQLREKYERAQSELNSSVEELIQKNMFVPSGLFIM